MVAAECEMAIQLSMVEIQDILAAFGAMHVLFT